ncbi:3',5'-cyclic adenosine monophosphate phosphodiesterase CpdA [uncultured archaeon]|nr:3',5'-cyclic adenosine monophosphate phosphodiesterase CpdA [uncultured archaeon]
MGMKFKIQYTSFYMKSKIIQISDLHLGFDSKKSEKVEAVDPGLKKRAIELISEEKPDAILVTGDLVNVPFEENFSLATNFLNSLHKFPLMCIPGNIDYYSLISRPQKPILKESLEDKVEEKLIVSEVELLKDPFRVDRSDMFRYLNIGLVKIKDRYHNFFEFNKDYKIYKKLDYYLKHFSSEPVMNGRGINFIGFDSFIDMGIVLEGIAKTNMPDKSIYLAKSIDGELSTEHLKDRLKKIKPGINIAVIHHPIFPIPHQNMLYGVFENGDYVARELLESGISLSFSGHKHVQGYTSRKIKLSNGEEKDFHVCTAGSLFSSDIKKPYKDNSFNIITIEDQNVSVDYRELRSGSISRLCSVVL